MQTKTNNQVYAGFFVRLAAYLIDWLVVGIALLTVRIPIWISSFAYPDNWLIRDFIFKYSIADIVTYVLSATYFILLTYYTGRTLGKRLLQLRVVSAEDRDMTFFEVVYRETVGKFLSGVVICIGYLMIGIDKEKRGIHDWLADTKVIYFHEKKMPVQTPVVYRNMQNPMGNPGMRPTNPGMRPTTLEDPGMGSINPGNPSMRPTTPENPGMGSTNPGMRPTTPMENPGNPDMSLPEMASQDPMQHVIHEQPGFHQEPQPAPESSELPSGNSEM